MIKKNIFKKVLIPIFLLFSIYAHNISSMQQDKQETIFAAHLANKSILIMSADTGNVLHTIEKGLYTQWSPDESYFAVQKNNTIEIWKTTHWKLSKILKPTGKIQSTLFSPDAKYLAVQVGNKDIEIWNTENWKNLTTLKHNNKIQSRQFSPDGRFFAVQAGDTVDIWDTEHWEKVHTLTYTGEIQAIAFSPNANVRYLAVQIGNTIEIWDTANWEKEPILLYKEKALRPFDSTQDQDDRQEEEIQSIVFSPNGRSFAVQWKDEVHIWNTANWNQEPTVLTREFRTGIIIFAPGDIHKRRKGKIQFSPDSKYLAVQIGEEDNIDIWDMTDLKKEPKTLLYTCGKLGKIAFTPGGNYFTVRIVHTVSNPQSDIWNTRNWKLIKSLRYPNTIWLGKFSPDDRYFITYIWNIQEMQILDTRNWHVKHAKKLDKQIWSIAFQPSKAKWKQQQERFRKAKEAQETSLSEAANRYSVLSISRR